MKKEKSFDGSVISNGILFDLSNTPYPSLVHGFRSSGNGPGYRTGKPASTTYGYVFEGNASLKYAGMMFPLKKGMYFTAPGEIEIFGGEGILIEFINQVGLFSLGGPIEGSGRLNYINGCTDSLLSYPVRKGDPCLNALYFPSETIQTQHTHPSYRIGLISDGAGICVTPEGNIDLVKGMVFVINESRFHSFSTSADQAMTVISFHPETDFGPDDEDHPMINRTMVDGMSANKKPELFTS